MRPTALVRWAVLVPAFAAIIVLLPVPISIAFTWAYAWFEGSDWFEMAGMLFPGVVVGAASVVAAYRIAPAFKQTVRNVASLTIIAAAALSFLYFVATRDWLDAVKVIGYLLGGLAGGQYLVPESPKAVHTFRAE